MIKMSCADLTEKELDEIKKVFEGGYLGMGHFVREFEEKMRLFFNNSVDVVSVNTGTSALHLAMQACEIGFGDEVLVPTLTYVGSFQAVSATGAKPVACDIDPTFLTLTVEECKKRITNRTKAIMPVHYAGSYGNLDEIYEFAKNNNLRVIEDAAHTFGCYRNEQKVGKQGDIVCFSFDNIKSITCGEGGMVVTKDQEIIRKVKNSRLLNVENDTDNRFKNQRNWDFDVLSQGWRYHLGNLYAAIGTVQLERLPLLSKKRSYISKFYAQHFQNCDEIELIPIDYNQVFPYIFVLLINNNKRDQLRQFLKEKNIETGIHYKPNHLLSYYKTDYALKNAEEIYQKILTIPCHTLLKQDDLDYIILNVLKGLNSSAKKL